MEYSGKKTVRMLKIVEYRIFQEYPKKYLNNENNQKFSIWNMEHSKKYYTAHGSVKFHLDFYMRSVVHVSQLLRTV